MKIKIGQCPNDSFQIFGKDGEDITRHFLAKSIRFEATGDIGQLQVDMTLYLDEIEIDTSSVKIEFDSSAVRRFAELKELSDRIERQLAALRFAASKKGDEQDAVERHSANP